MTCYSSVISLAGKNKYFGKPSTVGWTLERIAWAYIVCNEKFSIRLVYKNSTDLLAFLIFFEFEYCTFGLFQVS